MIADVRAQRIPLSLEARPSTPAGSPATASRPDGIRVVVAALVTTTAFTMAAFTYAVDKLRVLILVGEPKSRLTKFEQSQLRERQP